ncbi:hypothetical protein NST07_10600 [Paenibacillus sp. FSL L8-0340]|uniref:hypothetical protein n=1 Tax=Paenibacillus sp. FSL L8-0340 TaxID=2954685 RepID=UPI0031581ACD
MKCGWDGSNRSKKNRLKNGLSGPQKALDGPSDFSFSKSNKSLPQNSQQKNFWSEMEAGKEDLAKKMPGGTGDHDAAWKEIDRYRTKLKEFEPLGDKIPFKGDGQGTIAFKRS